MEQHPQCQHAHDVAMDSCPTERTYCTKHRTGTLGESDPKTNPQNIGRMVEVAGQQEAQYQKDLEGVLVPKTGQHRGGAIPRWVCKQLELT